jgi:hypothetical protein
MFSILVCSINALYLERLKINLNQKVGQPFELLIWDNLAEPKPITEVYNQLASQAKYPYWCFIHEDISFLTMNWAEHLKKAFEDHPETGLIGIAGAKYKSKTPSGWSTGLLELDCCNIYHKDENGHEQHIYMNPGKSDFEPVVNVDGVFIAIRREVWKNAHFNEKDLRGFHLYDIDFSMHVVKNWKAAVVFTIDIMHFTQGGNYGDAWLEPTFSWHEIFSNQLPQSIRHNKSIKSIEKKIAIFWLRRLSTEIISWKNKMRWVRAGKTWFYPEAWLYIGVFLFKRRL